MQRLLLRRAASRAAAIGGLLAPPGLGPRHHPAAGRAAASSTATPADADAAPPPTTNDDEPTCVRARLAPVAGPLAEVLSDALLGFGAQSVTVAELRRPGEPEHPIFDAGGRTGGGASAGGGTGFGAGDGGDTGYWPRCEVIAHFPLEADADAAIRDACAVADGVAGVLLAEAGGGAGAGGGQGDDDSGYSLPPPYLLAAVANREWVEQIKASYVPLDVVPGVVRIVPEGDAEAEEEERGGSADESGGRRTRLRLVLRPGVAFGTGEHPTTRLCLKAVARLGGLQVDGGAGGGGGGGEQQPSFLSSGGISGGGGAGGGQEKGAPVDVLDYGTGSGVLAVAALLLGARRAVGTDTDPLAVRASGANARLNGVSGRFAAVQVPPSLPEEGAGEDPVEAQLRAVADGAGAFGLVVANILRGPLLELAPRLARLCAPGGRLLLSGVLAEQAPEVRRRYEGLGFGGFVVETEGSWACLSAVKEGAGAAGGGGA